MLVVLLSSGIISVDAVEEPTVEWERTFGRSNEDIGYSVQQTSDNGYIIVGYTFSNGANDDVYLIKTYSNGTKQWEKPLEVGVMVTMMQVNQYNKHQIMVI